MLGQRGGALPAGAVYVVRFMVINALGPALLAMLAMILLGADFPQPALWRLCSAIYLAGAVFFGVLSYRQQTRLSGTGELLLSGPLSASIWIGSFVAHAIEVANLVGLPEPSMAVFLLGLWVLLVMAGVQFVALLFIVLR